MPFKVGQHYRLRIKKRYVKKGASKSFLNIGCINAHSICNKVPGVLELLKDNNIHICFLTESWLKFAEIREHGYNIFSAPRKGQSGGVGFLYDSTNVNLKRNNVNSFK